jgi:hypothetical protein
MSKVKENLFKQYSKKEISLLTFAFDKSELTIKRWIANNDDRLTSEKAKKALKSYKNATK